MPREASLVSPHGRSLSSCATPWAARWFVVASGPSSRTSKCARFGPRLRLVSVSPKAPRLTGSPPRLRLVLNSPQGTNRPVCALARSSALPCHGRAEGVASNVVYGAIFARYHPQEYGARLCREIAGGGQKVPYGTQPSHSSDRMPALETVDSFVVLLPAISGGNRRRKPLLVLLPATNGGNRPGRRATRFVQPDARRPRLEPPAARPAPRRRGLRA